MNREPKPRITADTKATHTIAKKGHVKVLYERTADGTELVAVEAYNLTALEVHGLIEQASLRNRVATLNLIKVQTTEIKEGE